MRREISGKLWPRGAAPILAAAEARSNGSRSGTKTKMRAATKMPDYDFECDKCKKSVTITASISEMEAGLACPICGSRNIERIFTPISSLGGCADSPTFAPG